MPGVRHTSIPRLETGIPGFDVLSDGGLPAGRLTVVVGAAGTGKTVLAMQIALNAAHRGQGVVYVCFEENPQEGVANLRSFEWQGSVGLETRIRFVASTLADDATTASTSNLSELLAAVEAHVKELNAAWVILDGLDSLLAMLMDPLAERREIYRLKRWLQRTRLGCIVTAKERDDGGLYEIGQIDGLLPFAADCVIRLRASAQERTLQRFIRIQKFRGGASLGGDYPFCIGPGGLSVDCAGLS